MKFNLPTPQPQPDRDESLRIGNVYACKGCGKTRYWIVLGLDQTAVNLVGVNREGVVTSTQNYGRHVFESPAFNHRRLLGRVEGLSELEFDVQWFGDDEKGQGAPP